MPSPNSRAGALLLMSAAILAGCGTAERPRAAGRGRPVSDVPVKIGAPYRAGGRMWVPADDPRYDAVGLASWYGGAHRGRATANGERFDPGGISAAHPTLPLPSYAEVTALATGRTILVRINDRGPFSGGRIIDLSQGAARLLGVERDGVARVRVRRVDPPEADRAQLRAGRPAGARPTPATLRPIPRPVPPAEAAGGEYFVQAGAFDDADRADAFASRLGALGPAAIVAVGPLWRVRLGPYAGEADALSALARARAAGYQDARVIRESAPLTARSQEDR